jgi:hypothetical protein
MTIEEEFQEVKNAFSNNLESVEDLLEFDQTILNLCLEHLNELEKELKEHGFDNPSYSVDNTTKVLKNIREHGSTKTKYRTIANQCLVLTVSHFASAIHDLFKICINYAFRNEFSKKLAQEEFKFSVRELAELVDEIDQRIGEIISEKNSISFQNMGNIARNFNDNFGYDIDKKANINNIIFGQACRHAIVHSGEKVDRQLLRQIEAAKPNDIKLDLKEGEIIYFDKSQLDIVMKSMMEYLDELIAGMKEHWDLAG